MSPVSTITPKAHPLLNWGKLRKPLLYLTCVLIGAMMLYRGITNLSGYPSDWISLFPNNSILGEICRIPSRWERWGLGPVFLGGVFGIVLMAFERRIGWWIFTALNFLVGFWFIYILEDIWQHHVMPHIVFSAVFLPFLPGMRRSELAAKILGWVVGRIAPGLLRLLQRPWVGRLIVAIPSLHKFANKVVINRIVGQARYRPHPFSTKSSFTSWASLTEKEWSGRHLGVSEIDQDSLPYWDGENGLKPVFQRSDGVQRMCPKSTCLFPAFAQYLTDGFIRTVDEKDDEGNTDEQRRKLNTSNHEIDMSPLYGRIPEQTDALRLKSNQKGSLGRLKWQELNGEVYPEYLYENNEIKEEFRVLDTPLGQTALLNACMSDDETIATHARDRRDALFAVGGDRANSVPQVSMMNTLWLREHNRLAEELEARNPSWDDNRVFETARNIVIVEFIKIVVEDYINHIAPFAMPLLADPSVAWTAEWNRANWITTEFSLLYRWHALIPDQITWGDKNHKVDGKYFLNNLPLIKVGMARACEDMSAQAAGELGPRNTTKSLLMVEWDSIRQGRICELQSYNKYREYLGRAPAKDFNEISSDPKVQEQLRKAYVDVDRVDFHVGIFCEDRVQNSPLPRMILTFVALDAFSQALPNPLLSRHVFGPQTFTDYGMEQIESCTTLSEVVARNVPNPDQLGRVAMTQADWQPKFSPNERS